MSILDFICLGRENPEQIDAFAPLIPTELVPRIKSGEMLGLGSLLGDMPNGAAVFQTEGDTAWLHSLYVDEYDRRRGTGSELIEELRVRLAALGGIYSLQVRLPGRCSEGVLRFFSVNGFEFYEGEGREARVLLSSLKAIKLPEPKLKTVSGAKMERSVLRRLESELKSKDLYFLEGSLEKAPVCRELCSYTVENGVVTAAAVVTEKPLSLAYLFGDNSAALGAVLYSARAAVLEKYSEDEMLCFDAVSESGSRLAAKLLQEKELLPKQFARKTI